MCVASRGSNTLVKSWEFTAAVKNLHFWQIRKCVALCDVTLGTSINIKSQPGVGSASFCGQSSRKDWKLEMCRPWQAANRRLIVLLFLRCFGWFRLLPRNPCNPPKFVDRSQEVASLCDGIPQPTLILSGISVLMKKREKSKLINYGAGLNINQDVLILINRELIPSINNASYSNCVFPREHAVRIIARKKKTASAAELHLRSVRWELKSDGIWRENLAASRRQKSNGARADFHMFESRSSSSLAQI